MNKDLQTKLSGIPMSPGVYFHKNKAGEIIYIGKAARLRNRVRQYFQSSRSRDPKTESLVSEIYDVDWIELETELDALFVEAEYIRRYMPPYNILLRDDKSMSYVRININDPHPTVTLTRRPLDDGAKYYGPYFSTTPLRRALKFLRKIYPYSTHNITVPKRACLQYHLGLCPGLEVNPDAISEYKINLKKLMQYLSGNRSKLITQTEKEMKSAAKKRQYEEAAKLRNQFLALKGLTQRVVFSDREFLDISKDQGLSGLKELLGISGNLKTIEGYDISHMQGTDNTASMVVFRSGVPDKASYRKFKMRLIGNDDFAHMREVIKRRFSQQNIKNWGKPDLILIDGGRGQLKSAAVILDEYGYKIPIVGLAKREEEIIVHKSLSSLNINHDYVDKQEGQVIETDDFIKINLPENSHEIKLIQRIRDESHRFALSYHSSLKRKRQTASLLDDIPTIGPATRKKLIRTFGSLRGVQNARRQDLEALIGTKKATILRQYLRQIKKSERVL